MADGAGFEPARGFRPTAVFGTAALLCSANHPKKSFATSVFGKVFGGKAEGAKKVT